MVAAVNAANIWSRHEMRLGDVVKGKLVMLFRRLVLFARISGGKFGKVVKEKLVMLFGRLVLFAPNVGRNRGNDNEDKLEPQFEWPYVMNSSVAMRRPLVSGTWIWHHQPLAGWPDATKIGPASNPFAAGCCTRAGAQPM